MTRQVLRAFLVAVLVLGLGGTILAQRDKTTSFETSFEFQMGGATYAAGKYQVSHRMGEPFVRVTNLGNNSSQIVRYITRISKKCDACTKSGGAVVFDTDGNSRFLTELYMGDFDGYLFEGAPGEHEHQRIPSTS